jgi:hypothetical protein
MHLLSLDLSWSLARTTLNMRKVVLEIAKILVNMIALVRGTSRNFVEDLRETEVVMRLRNSNV